MKKTSWLRRIFAFALALGMCFSMQAIPAHAAETVENDMNVMTIEEAGFTREEALEILGMTEEEAKEVNFYAVRAINQVALSPGDVWTPNAFSFTGENTGSYFTVNANKIKFGVVWEPASKTQATQTRIYLWPYGSNVAAGQMYFESSMIGSNGKASKTSDWINATYGLDYHFLYDCYYIGSAAQQATCTITLVVGVA